jgi:hypothetical protein
MRVLAQYPHCNINIRLLHRLRIVSCDGHGPTTKRMKRTDGIVAKKRENTVPVVAETEMTRALELVDEVEAIRVVSFLIRLYEPPV